MNRALNPIVTNTYNDTCSISNLSFANTHNTLIQTKTINLFKLKLASLILILGLVITIAASISEEDSTAVKAADNSNITYISIPVSYNDTLWGIADEYYSGEFGSIKSYIKEIKRCNNLKSDTIYAGKHIVVPVYVRPSDALHQ